MTRPEPPPGGELLLHCTLERTLLLGRDGSTGELVVDKLLLRGSALDAEHECQTGRLLRHLDVAQYLSAGTHAATGRPCVRMRYHDGQSLDAIVGDRGAPSAAEVCALMMPVAQTLAAMHAMRGDDLPQGLCHGDLKPSNLLRTDSTTLLLDFEHAGPALQGACSGTPGFAGPEAQVGAPLTPAFDVYGLGATLHWMLTGRTPRPGLLAAHDEELQLLVAACLSPAPTLRPSATIVAEALTEIGQRLQSDPLEPARTALLSGDLESCRQRLAGTTEPAAAGLRALLARRERLLQRRPDLLTTVGSSDRPEEPGHLADRLSLLAALLHRFPHHRTLVATASAERRRAGKMLAASLPSVSEFVRAEAFERAHTRLRDLRRLCLAAQALPGPLAVPGQGAVHMPSLLQRSPLTHLQQEEQRLQATEAEHRQLLETLQAAEAELAFEDANAIVDAIGGRFGGASEAVARHRDRQHRLAFYVERIARARPNIDRLRELVPDEDPSGLLRFVDECAAAMSRTATPADRKAGVMGLRSLHLALGNLHEEFPAVRERAAPGLASLDRMLSKVTDEAWQLLADAERKLQIEPVPVRPLQVSLGRLDTFRTLEAFVDRPQHSRSALIDRIEALRLRLEQAQATRDRLARGAEQALAKGHWTTGLFDMERAVTHLDTEDEADREAIRLRQRLAEARKRKQEIEVALRRNHELSNRYADLQDETGSTTQERLQVLREQRDTLQFLAMHATKERGSLLTRDLHEVELRIAHEQSSQAETELDLAEGLAERRRISEQTLVQLETFAGSWQPGSDLPGRLSRLLEHWRRRLRSLQRETERREKEQVGRRRRHWLAAAGSVALALATGLALRFWPESVDAASVHPLMPAARALPGPLRPSADALLQAVAKAQRDTSAGAASLLHAAERAVGDYLEAMPVEPRDPAGMRFAADVWSHTVAVAGTLPGGDSADFATAAESAADRLRRIGLPE